MKTMVQSKLTYSEHENCWERSVGRLKRRYQLDLTFPPNL